MAEHLIEDLDRLPHGGPARRRRYDTTRYRGATGRNWYADDPSLQRLLHRHLGDDALAWATPHLERVGALMGGPVAERAEETDRQRPRLERYDRWGRDVSRVVLPASAEASRRDLLADSFADPAFRERAQEAGANPGLLNQAWNYLLSQAEIGMFCALGTGGDMVLDLTREFAPDDVAARVDELLGGGMLSGETAQLFTERTGGSDLGALETTATRAGDAWSVSGHKWFVSNVDGAAYVVLAKPEGASDDARGVLPFLVLWERRDGSRNGISIRRLKDKLGTHAVASAEVELRDAEAFLLAADPDAAPGHDDAGERTGGGPRRGGSGLGRMMAMTNGARLGISVMGLGVARRALVESLCYAASREAFGAPLDQHPLMRRKLAELIVEVEATQQLVFDGYVSRLRIGAPLIKLKAARLGITAASDAIEIHGGNGYIEQWPVARLLRDAQVNTVWEGPDNILCLDVRRAMVKETAHEPLLARVRTAVAAGPDDAATVALVERGVEGVEQAVAHWRTLPDDVAEARLFPLSQYLGDVYAAALLLEQAGWEERTLGSDRGTLVARLYARAHLAEPGPLRGIDAPAEELERFAQLRAGALSDEAGG